MKGNVSLIVSFNQVLKHKTNLNAQGKFISCEYSRLNPVGILLPSLLLYVTAMVWISVTSYDLETKI